MTSNRDLTLTLLFEFLLCLTLWAYDLTNIVQGWIVGLRYVDFALLLWGLVVRRRLVCLIHCNDFIDEA